MDQHPVPRNISGFQFHLVGDMTLQQFGYLAGGIIIGFFIYKALPLPSIITLPLAGFVALIGVAFAFLPIQDRPLDKWLVLFIRSMYAPTQFLWQKEGVLPSVLMMPSASHIQRLTTTNAAAHEDARQKLKTYIATLPVAPHQVLNTAEKAYLDKTTLLFSTTSVHTQTVPVASAPPIVVPPVSVVVEKSSVPEPVTPSLPPTPTREAKEDALPVQKAESDIIPSPIGIPIEKPVVAAQPVVSPVSNQTNASVEYEALQKKMQELAFEKEKLAKELEFLKLASEKQKDTVIVKPVVMQENSPTIKSVTAKTAVQEIGMPSLSTYPNLIVGAVKDGERKVLPNILITIKDKNGVPLRALKTNKLGQFAAATPLPNGLYYIEIEDPLKRFTFDMAEVTLSGAVFLPIEITAKSQKEIMREQLSKALFGNPVV
jgi:hypothetical protein